MSTTTEIALSPDQRARQVLRLDERKAELSSLASQSKDLTEITNPAGYQQVHAARMVLKNTRVDIEKAGKDARDDANKFSKAVIAVEKELVELIRPEEDRLGAIQQAWDDEKAREKAAREKAEAERKAAVRARILAVENLPIAMVGHPVADIDAAIARAEAADFTDLAGEEQIHAAAARSAAIEKLGVLREQRLAADAEAARLAEEAERLAEKRRRLEEEERAARARREEEDRFAAEERRKAAEAEEERLRAEREEQARQAAEERAERDRRQAEEDRQRQEQIEAENRKRQEEEARLAEERERLARERAEQEAAARRREINNATLKGSAAEARLRLIELGDGDSLLVAKLTAVLRVGQEQEA